MLNVIHPPSILTSRLQVNKFSQKLGSFVVCGARGPRPRFPRVWKTRYRIGTISKSDKLVESIKGLSNVKEEVYGALDSFVAWDLEFPLIVVKKALKTLELQQEWKRIIQVIKWMLNKGQGQTMGTYYTLLTALTEDGRLEEAEELWTKIFSRYLDGLPRVFYIKMISLYYTKGLNDKMFEVFADMEELGVRPDRGIVRMVGDVFQKLGMHDKYKRLHLKYPPPKWEYRYIKGKRVKIPVKHLIEPANSRAESRKKRLSSADDAVGALLLHSPEDEGDEFSTEVDHFRAAGSETEERNGSEPSISHEGEREGEQVVNGDVGS